MNIGNGFKRSIFLRLKPMDVKEIRAPAEDVRPRDGLPRSVSEKVADIVVGWLSIVGRTET